MPRKNRTYRIMVIPEQNGKPAFSISLSSVWVPVVCAGFALAVIASGFLMYKSVRVAKKLHYYYALQNENERLSGENTRLRLIQRKFGHMDSLASYLEQLARVPAAASIGAPIAKGGKTPAPSDPSTERAESAVPGKKIAGASPVPPEVYYAAIPSRLPVEGWVTQEFNVTKDGTTHRGMDIAASEGIAIVAPAPGTVLSVVDDKDYGILIEIKHKYGFVTRYGHCEKSLVVKNEKVDRGQNIALVGNTGHSSAPHLHYEVLLNGKNVNPQDYSSPKNISYSGAAHGQENR